MPKGDWSMKYQCSNGHKFIHPKKARQYEDNSSISSNFEEWYICPICSDQDFDEYVEPKIEITSVKSVDLSEVDTYLKEGYLVESLYAKNAVLVKKEVPKNE